MIVIRDIDTQAASINKQLPTRLLINYFLRSRPDIVSYQTATIINLQISVLNSRSILFHLINNVILSML